MVGMTGKKQLAVNGLEGDIRAKRESREWAVEGENRVSSALRVWNAKQNAPE